MRSSLTAIVSVGVLVLWSDVVIGQSYPTKPVRIVTGSVGSAVDFAARMIAPGLTTALGRQVIVINQSGRPEVVAQAAPDGYTLLVNANAMWLAPFLVKTSYDPVADFSPISWMVSTPNILVVHPSLPVKSVKELIALAKARPGELNYGSSTIGGAPQLAAELFKALARVDIVGIPYKGSGPAVSDLLGGQLHLMFPSALSVVPHVKSGRLRSLAVTSARASALFPDLPTVGATVPGYESVGMIGLFAPANTPEAIVKRLNQEVARILAIPEIKERFLNTGVETVGASPPEFSRAIKTEMTKIGKVIKDAGIKAE